MDVIFILTGTALTKDKVVRTEQLTERTSTDGVHGTGLEIDENSSRDIFVARSLQGKSVDIQRLAVRVLQTSLK